MTDNTEIKWKWLNEEQKYKVYEDGTVYSEISNNFLNIYITKNAKYRFISLKVSNKTKQFTLPKLIYNTFSATPSSVNSIIINIDGNLDNNKFSNLKIIPRHEYKLKKNPQNKKITVLTYDTNIWKPILGYENRYIINRDGDIMSLIKNKILVDNHHKKMTQSYIACGLTDENEKRTNYPVHRLVYSTYHNIPLKDFGDKVIDHIDRNKFNNKLDNLRLVSISENNKNIKLNRKNRENNIKPKSDDFVIISTKIKNYDISNYEINSYGQVRNILNKKKILLTQNHKGYECFGLHPKNTTKSVRYFIHQLVGHTFISNPNNLPMINHIDKNRSNNHVSNLEWINNRDNIIHSSGKKVGQYSLNNELIKVYRCIADACKTFGKTKIYRINLSCNNNDTNKKITARGFIWKFLDENDNPIPQN
jgi:hypothetical protein